MFVQHILRGDILDQENEGNASGLTVEAGKIFVIEYVHIATVGFDPQAQNVSPHSSKLVLSGSEFIGPGGGPHPSVC